MNVGVGGAGNEGNTAVSSGRDIRGGGGGREGLDRGIVAGSFRFLESTGKASHTVSHYRLMLVMSFCG